MRQRGFSLVELIAGIVLMTIALTLLINVFFTGAGRSVEPLLQIRAAEFGQALMEEIAAKRYDEQTPVGGQPACTGCTAPAGLGPDSGELTRDVYDDVDDYNVYCPSRQALVDFAGNPLPEFVNFEMQVCVFYDGDYDGVDDAASADAKLIIVDIYAPQAGGGKQQIQFTRYRSNF